MEADASPLRKALPALCIAVVASVLPRLGALSHGFVNYDDVSQIVENPLVRAPLSQPPLDFLLSKSHGYIVPFTLAWDALLYRLGGGSAFAFHFVSLLLHAALVALLFESVRRRSGTTTALVASLAFGLHPVTVEPVAWATGLKDGLAAFLVVTSTLLFERSSQEGAKASRHLVGAVALAALAPLAKPTAALIGLGWLLSSLVRPKASSSERIAALGVAVFGGIMAFLSRIAHDGILARDDTVQKVHHSAFDVLSVLGRNLSRLAFPIELHPVYESSGASPLVDPFTYAGLAGLLGLLMLASRTRHKPGALVWWWVAAFSYLPVSNLLPFERRIADSYLYLPLFSICVALGRSLDANALKALGNKSKRRLHVLAALAATLGVLLGTLTYRQTGRYKDSITLWLPAHRAMPEALAPLHGLASELLRRGDAAKAAAYYEQMFALGYRKDALGDYAVALAMLGRTTDAECVFVEDLLVGSESQQSLENLGRVFANKSAPPPRYPAETLALLETLLTLRQTSLKPHELARLARYLERHGGLAAPVGPTPWRRGKCPLLAPKKKEGSAP